MRDLAPGFASDGNVTNLLRNLFLHPDFLSDRIRFGLVRSPVVWLVTACRTLGVTPNATMVEALGRQGQQPFSPPNVAGWPPNGAWLNTAMSLERLKMALSVAAGADLSSVASAAPTDRPAIDWLTRMLDRRAR